MTAIAERELAAPVVAGAHLEELSIDLVDVGDNVRIDPGELEGLAATISEHGVIQAVGAVGPDAKGRYSLVFGQRRLLASKLAGRTTIPTIVRSSAEAGKPGAQRSLEQLVENLERADLNPIDEAKALAAIVEADLTLTQAALAKQLGRSAPWVANTLALLRIDKTVQEKIAAGKLTAAHARAIGGLEHADQAALAEKAVAQGWSAHDLERQAQWAKQNAKGRAAERERSAKLATQVVAALEKAAAKDATIAVRGDKVVAQAVRKAGWTNVRTDLGYGSVDTVKNAGECGCKAWLVDGWSDARVTPACIDKDHIAARKTTQNAEWERQREAANRERKADEAVRTRRAEGIGAFLAGALEGELARRLTLYAVLGGEDENLVERYLGAAEGDRIADAGGDDLWQALLAVPPEKLALELGQAVGERMLNQWHGGSKEVLAVIDAAMPPVPAKPARAKKPKADA